MSVARALSRRRGLRGTTTAPIFATAQYVSNRLRQLRRTVATLSPLRTFKLDSAFASRLTRTLKSRNVSRESSHTTAVWSGRYRACLGSIDPIFTSLPHVILGGDPRRAGSRPRRG